MKPRLCRKAQGIPAVPERRNRHASSSNGTAAQAIDFAADCGNGRSQNTQPCHRVHQLGDLPHSYLTNVE
jgi:hypothetical protein